MRWPAVLIALWLPAVPGVRGEPAIDDARVRQTAEEILSRPEYERLRRRLSAHDERSRRCPAGTRCGEAGASPGDGRRQSAGPLGDHGGAPFSSAPASGVVADFLKVLVYALLVLTVLGLLVLVVIRRRREPSAAEAPPGGQPAPTESPASAPGERASGEYLQQARAHARAGRHREAIRLLLGGAMSFIERRGLIEYRRGLTNADYLRSVRREPRLRASLEPIVTAFDEIHFGGRGATPERFDQCLRHYRAAFEQE